MEGLVAVLARRPIYKSMDMHRAGRIRSVRALQRGFAVVGAEQTRWALRVNATDPTQSPSSRRPHDDEALALPKYVLIANCITACKTSRIVMP